MRRRQDLGKIPSNSIFNNEGEDWIWTVNRQQRGRRTQSVGKSIITRFIDAKNNVPNN